MNAKQIDRTKKTTSGEKNRLTPSMEFFGKSGAEGWRVLTKTDSTNNADISKNDDIANVAEQIVMANRTDFTPNELVSEKDLIAMLSGD